MNDFVAEHVGEFVLGIGQGEQSAGYEDVSPRQCERVGRILVDDLEAVGKARTGRVLREAIPHTRDVPCQGRVVDETDGLGDFLGRFSASALVVCLAVENDVRLALLPIFGGPGGRTAADQQQLRSMLDEMRDSITAQPSAVSAEKNTDVQFSVGLSHEDAGALIFWKVNDQLQGQGSVFTISEVSDELDGAKVQAVVVYNGVQYSDEVALTVTGDKAPPSVVSTDGSRFMETLSLTFNEDIEEASAGKASNYRVAGLDIDSAELVGRKVTLFTAKQTPGKVYTVNVSGVEDLAGNAFSGAVNIQAYLEVTGYLWWDYWGGIGGAHPMEALTDDERYPDNPDSSQLLPFLNTRWATGFHNDANSNYGARASGLLVAPEDGEYRFWLRSDDHGQVWVSMDEDPENVELIAEQTGCCNGFTLDDGGLSGLVELEEGQRYYFEALLKEGGGGDWMNVMWTRPSEWDFDAPPWNDSGISGEHFVNYVPADGFTGDADIYHLGTQPPANGGDGLTVREFHDIGGARVADLLVHSKWPNSPDFVGVADYAEWPQSGDINVNPPGNVRDNYATHMLGFVHPPETDEYQFFVAADDASVLFLSTDETPANKQLIAIEPSWNGVREFEQTRNRWIVDVDSERQINGSAPTRLEAGKAYFIEAIIKKVAGCDNVQRENFSIIGSSNGAALVNQLAIECRLPNIRNYVSGVSPLNVYQHDGKAFKAKGENNTYRKSVEPMKGKRLMNISGTEDKLVPYRGGLSRAIPAMGGKLGFVHAEHSTYLWAKAMGYDGEKLTKPSEVEGNLEKFSYLGGSVVHYKVKGEGHGAMGAISEDRLLSFLEGGEE